MLVLSPKVMYNRSIKRGDFMQRINIYVTEQQDKWLEEQSKKIGIGKSELLRRVLDKEMKKKQ